MKIKYDFIGVYVHNFAIACLNQMHYYVSCIVGKAYTLNHPDHQIADETEIERTTCSYKRNHHGQKIR